MSNRYNKICLIQQVFSAYGNSCILIHLKLGLLHLCSYVSFLTFVDGSESLSHSSFTGVLG